MDFVRLTTTKIKSVMADRLLVVCCLALFIWFVFFNYVLNANIIKELSPSSFDVHLYYQYSQRILGGEIPFLNLQVEYPPFAVPFFFLPALLCLPFGGLNFDLYSTLFHFECFLLEIATLLVLYKLVKKIYAGNPSHKFISGIVWLTLGSIASSIYLFQRFDIAATFLLSLAFYFVYNAKPGMGGFAIALGTWTKLYPVIALPFVLLYWLIYRKERREALICLISFVITTGIILLPFLILNANGLLAFLRYHSERGVQMEAVYANLIILAGVFQITKVAVVNDHNSWNIASPWSQSLATFSTLFLALGLLILFGMVWWAIRRNSPKEPGWLLEAVAIGILWFIISNKVLSPQYLIWLFPFVPFWKGLKQPLFLMAVILSFIPFPLLYNGFLKLDWLPVSLNMLRNLALLIIFCLLIHKLWLNLKSGGATPRLSHNG
ncbi:MAG TPA: glycosyltransferase 87 family protein [Chloroflexia bacterium]|nr:glycosyltransferase 87 family protein [Chloroflexia bacterium]